MECASKTKMCICLHSAVRRHPVTRRWTRRWREMQAKVIKQKQMQRQRYIYILCYGTQQLYLLSYYSRKKAVVFRQPRSFLYPLLTKCLVISSICVDSLQVWITGGHAAGRHVFCRQTRKHTHSMKILLSGVSEILYDIRVANGCRLVYNRTGSGGWHRLDRCVRWQNKTRCRSWKHHLQLQVTPVCL